MIKEKNGKIFTLQCEQNPKDPTKMQCRIVSIRDRKDAAQNSPVAATEGTQEKTESGNSGIVPKEEIETWTRNGEAIRVRRVVREGRESFEVLGSNNQQSQNHQTSAMGRKFERDDAREVPRRTRF